VPASMSRTRPLSAQLTTSVPPSTGVGTTRTAPRQLLILARPTTGSVPVSIFTISLMYTDDV